MLLSVSETNIPGVKIVSSTTTYNSHRLPLCTLLQPTVIPHSLRSRASHQTSSVTGTQIVTKQNEKTSNQD